MFWMLFIASIHVEATNSAYSQTELNALKAKATLTACIQNLDDPRKLIPEINRGILDETQSRNENNKSTPEDFQTFLRQFNQMSAVLGTRMTERATERYISLTRELRMKALTHILITAVEATLRFDLRPNQKSPRGHLNTDSLVKKVCANVGGDNTCWAQEIEELRVVAETQTKSFYARREKTISPNEARVVLNKSLDILNIAEKPLLEKWDEWRALGRTSRDQIGVLPSDGVAIDRSQLKAVFYLHDVKPVQERFKAFEALVKQLAQQGVGLLFYTETIRNEIHEALPGKREIRRAETVTSAIQEFKQNLIGLAKATNTDYESMFPRVLTQAERQAIGMNPVVELNPNAGIKNLVKTHAFALGALLVEHPELGQAVCDVTQQIAQEDQMNRNVRSGLQVVTHAAIIFSGIVAATGVGTVIGASTEAVALAADSALVASEIRVATLYSTLSEIGDYVGPSVLSANFLSIGKHRMDLSKSIEMNRRALLAGTGGNVHTMDSKELEYDGQLDRALILLAKLGMPYVANTLGKALVSSRVLQNSKILQIMEKLHDNVVRNPKAYHGLRVVSYVCGLFGVAPCQLMIEALLRLPQAKQESILSNSKSTDQFIETVLKPYKTSF